MYYVFIVRNGYVISDGEVIFDDAALKDKIDLDVIGLEILSTELPINGKVQNVPVFPIGCISITGYNDSLQRKRNTDFVHILNSWPFGYDPQPVNLTDLVNIIYSQETPETITAMFLDGYIVFQVNEISELYKYDMLWQEQIGLPVRKCKSCGRAFVAHSKAVYCKSCKDNHAVQKTKYTNLLNDPAAHSRKNLLQRIGKREGNTSKYKNDVVRLLNRVRDICSDSEYTEFIKQYTNLDTKYRIINRNLSTDCDWSMDKAAFPYDITANQNTCNDIVDVLSDYIDKFYNMI